MIITMICFKGTIIFYKGSFQNMGPNFVLIFFKHMDIHMTF
jgi:hypothetical protein